jgi:hypothetical protein
VILLAGGLAATLGMLKLQQRERDETVARLTARTEALERLLDSNRTTSSLTRHGRTNPRDL